jgi:hypothetical protein
MTLTGTVEGPPTADQETAPSFGQRGQIAIFGSSSIRLSSSTFDGSNTKLSSYTFSPGFDYFVARNIAIGLSLDAEYADEKDDGAGGGIVETQSTTLSAGARLGLNVPLRGRFSWYPRATVGLEWNKRNEQLPAGSSLVIFGGAAGPPSTTQLGPYVEIYAPLLLHPTDHFFFGFGPGLYHDFGSVSGGPNGGGQRTELSAALVIGGYWGGDAPPSRAPVDSPPPSKRFGDAREFVVTNDLVLSVRSQSYAGTDLTDRDIAVGGSLDYFVIDHVSIGLSARVSSSDLEDGSASSSASGTISQSELSFGPRLGVNFAIGNSFSIYPQFTLDVSHLAIDETSGQFQSSSTGDIVSVNFFVPLLAHPARHLFVGLGPSVNHEVSHTETFPAPLPTVQNRETTLGVGLVVGGWL